MIFIRDLILPLNYDEAKTFGIIMPPEVADAIVDYQESQKLQFRLAPQQLYSGDYALFADVLTEMPNGLYRDIYFGVGVEIFGDLRVVSWGDIDRAFSESMHT